MPTACSDPSHIAFSSFEPQAKFAFNRGYWKALSIVDRSTDIVQNENEIIVNSTDLPGLSLHYVINPDVWLWSSNVYTLDYVVCNAWYEFTAEPFPHDWAFELRWTKTALIPLPHLELRAAFSAIHEVLLSPPPGNSGYWAG